MRRTSFGGFVFRFCSMIVAKYEDIKRVDIKENGINTVKLLRIFFAVRMCVCQCVCGGGRPKLFTDRRSFRPSCSDSSSTRRCGCHQSRGESARTRRRVRSRAPELPDGRRWRERCSEWWRDWSDSIPGQQPKEQNKSTSHRRHL